MCISLNPAEFNGTVIANFPAPGEDPSRHALSYMNTVETGLRSHGITDAGPNAMIFPVYGNDITVLDVPDPETSRKWLTQQRGVYREYWEGDGPEGTRSGYRRVSSAGNYLVRIAADVEDIPAALEELRHLSPNPENVPASNDKVLAMMERFYHIQDLGVPRFVVAAFALPGSQVDKKNPITVHYTQTASLKDTAIFPALDYHGQGEFQQSVSRDHRLLLATPTLNEALGPVMGNQGSGQLRPAEFEGAPIQFPVEVVDTRSNSNDEHPSRVARNNDYFFNLGDLHTGIQSVKEQIAALSTPGPDDYRALGNLQKRIGKIVREGIGPYGLIGHSNQPATTAEEFARPDEFGVSHLVTDN